MNFDPVIYSIPIFFALITLELIYNWYRVKKQNKKSFYRLNDSLSNIGCGVIDQVSGVFAKVFTIGAYTVVFEWSRSFISFQIPDNWLWYIICFLAVDMFYYFAHRMSHEVHFMWMGHVVHHQSEDYNLSVALRQGAVQKLMTFWVYFPLAILGFPPEWFLISIGFNLLYQFWIHTETIGKMGFFESILNTPSHHRVHHGSDSKYIDKNHGGVFIIWDRLCGTFQEEEEKPTYGITDPTLTFNPVKAHYQPFVRLAEGVRKTRGTANKIRFIFRSPTWVANNLIKIEKKDITPARKFDYPLTKEFRIYLLVQFALNVAVGAVGLNLLDKMNMGLKIILAIHSLFYLLTIGLLLDKRRTGIHLEFARLTTFLVLPFVVSSIWNDSVFPSGTALLLSLIWVLLTVVSVFWFYKLNKSSFE